MPTLEFDITVAAPLAAVWAFFEDVPTSLPALTSPHEGIVVDSVDLPVHVDLAVEATQLLEPAR